MQEYIGDYTNLDSTSVKKQLFDFKLWIIHYSWKFNSTETRNKYQIKSSNKQLLCFMLHARLPSDKLLNKLHNFHSNCVKDSLITCQREAMLTIAPLCDFLLCGSSHVNIPPFSKSSGIKRTNSPTHGNVIWFNRCLWWDGHAEAFIYYASHY